MTMCNGLNASDDFSNWSILKDLQNLKSSKIVKDEEKNILFRKLEKKTVIRDPFLHYYDT